MKYTIRWYRPNDKQFAAMKEYLMDENEIWHMNLTPHSGVSLELATAVLPKYQAQYKSTPDITLDIRAVLVL